ncbi:Oidioi.mRNA.OKI2018_I69.PAR.g13047.t1.cds [Oikopleura dioica]|uniref:Oidioi.mRNA.OKI2018_I69.PAR.g13047.t1.cds n=1 Tax=Oikopleura dioica TaxID=34765 RepID=A0ABN7S3I3_OIKDI|nr:Oidioi.mRNA.OKI2018_I69.PAR.g13047.t1.cds [Oikopleura dioica]
MFDMLNSDEFMKMSQRNLAGWSYTFFDYWYHQVPAYFGTLPMQLAMSVFDPLTYASRYADQLIYITNAANDEFFPFDGPLSYWDMLPGKKLLRILPDQAHGGSWGGWDRDESSVSDKISRTAVQDVGEMEENTQDRLWQSVTALYKAFLSAPETIPSITTSFNETVSSMTLSATSSLAPESTRSFSRKSKNGKRDWRQIYYAGASVCGAEGIPGIVPNLRPDFTPFNRVDSTADAEQTLNLESTEENVWDGGFIDFVFSLDGEEFITSSLPGVTPSDKYPGEPCSDPLSCQGFTPKNVRKTEKITALTLILPFRTFKPGTGYATFDAFQVTNTDKSVEFEFNIDFPAEFDLNATVPAVFSSTHDFLAKTTTGGNETCEVIEGEGFDLQEIWNGNCSVICTLPCEDAGGLLSTSPKCHSRETTECGPYGSCTEETGCVCDLESMPEPDQINIDDHVHLSCNSRDEMVVKVDKCLMHRLGFKLEDLSINGINPTDPLQPSGLNTCVGKLDYETETDYKFALYGDEACRMQKTSNATHDVYTNAIFGSMFQGENGSIQTVEVYSEFSCTFEGKS